MSKKETYKEMNEKDLVKKLKETRDALRTFKFGSKGSKAKNVKEGHTLKIQIARILTELTAKGVKIHD